MPAPNGAGNSRKSGHGHQKTRSVKPVIPLPHVKRQAAAAAVAAVATSTRGSSSPEPQPKTGSASPADQTKDRLDSSLADNTSVNREILAGGLATAASGSPPAAEPNGHVESEALLPQTYSADSRAPSNYIANAHEADVNHTASQSAIEADQNFSDGGKPREEQSAPGDINNHVPSHAPREKSPVNQTPSAHQPTNNLYNPTANGYMIHAAQAAAVVNGRSQMHKHHPSGSGVHFGTFENSSNGSPAPPSGGIAPPPGMPPQHQRQLSHHAGSGFPPSIPPGLDMMAAGNFDAYGRQGPPYSSMDQYQHQGANFPPSTPHSFQDSQTSVHTDDPGTFHNFGLPANHNGFGDDSAARNAPARLYGMGFPGMGPQQGHPPSMMGHADDAGGLIDHFQQQCGIHDFADCSLELRNRDPRIQPIRIPAHRVVLSRSPVLYSILSKQLQERTPQVLVLEADDDWIRPDSFYMAFQRLYGLPLLHAPPPQHGMDMDSMAARSNVERFNFALSYAAAGRLLGWDPVVRRGCEIAGQLLHLETVETAMKFALSQYEDKGSYETFKYGDGSRILLDAVLGFTAGKLSSTFRLDTSVTNLQGYARLPCDSASPTKPVPTQQESSSPVVVRGNANGHFSKSSRTSNYPPIQFGDLSLSNEVGHGPSETPRASLQANTPLHAALSRILINMPFGYLKMLLESGPSNIGGMSKMDFRLPVIQQAIQEREGRRSRALEAVNAGQVADSGLIQSGLYSLEPPQSTPWTVLGWQEEVNFPNHVDAPSLIRQWRPLKQSKANAISDYP